MYRKQGLIIVIVMIVLELGYSTPPTTWPLVEETEHELELVGEFPKVGEVFEVMYRVRLKPDIDPVIGENKFYVKFRSSTVAILRKEEICIPHMVPGIWQEIRGQFHITEPIRRIHITGLITGAPGSYGSAGKGMSFFLVDSPTGQYIPSEVLEQRKISVLCKYNNVEPEWLTEPDCAWKESNKKIAEEMRFFEPALTDSEALCLHFDNVSLIINAIGNPLASDIERIEHMLEDGWLKAQHGGREVKQQWLQEFMGKNQGEWE